MDFIARVTASEDALDSCSADPPPLRARPANHNKAVDAEGEEGREQSGGVDTGDGQ